MLALFVTPGVVVAGGAVSGFDDRVGSWGSSPGPGIVPNVIPISEKGEGGGERGGRVPWFGEWGRRGLATLTLVFVYRLGNKAPVVGRVLGFTF